MAQDPLKRAVAFAALLGVALASERVAPTSPTGLTVSDAAVGIVIGGGAVATLHRVPRVAWLAFAVSMLWFLGTLSAASSSTLGTIGALSLLGHRGPLMHLLLAVPDGRLHNWRVRSLAAVGWVAAFLPLTWSGPSTAAIAAFAAVSTAMRAGRAGSGRRGLLISGAVAAGSLSILWTLAVFGAGDPTVLLLVDEALTMCAAVLAFSATTDLWRRDVERALVIKLGTLGRSGRPLTSLLARSLADPAVEVRYEPSSSVWIDERGLASTPPEATGRRITKANAPGGGTVAVVHGAASLPNPRLDGAAAAAAALALDAARLEADVRARAREVRSSRRRLLEVEDAEREAIARRLHEEVLTRLGAVEPLLTTGRIDTAALRRELQASIAELMLLGQGLYPAELTRGDLVEALNGLVDRSTCPTVLETHGDLTDTSEAQRVAAWFICSEALANIAQHARASRATLTLTRAGSTLELKITDDGCGGATLTRGLQGLADRAAAMDGVLRVASPAGGPTVIQAVLPVGQLPDPSGST